MTSSFFHCGHALTISVRGAPKAGVAASVSEWRSRLVGFTAGFSLLVCIAAFLPGTHAATIELGSNTVSRGVQVEVPLVADVGAEPLGRYEVFIRFDTNVVQFVGFTSTDLHFPEPVMFTGYPGEVRMCANNKVSRSQPTGSVEVGRMVFQVVGRTGERSTLLFTRAEILKATDARATPTTSKDGAITVSSAAGTP